MKASLKWPLVTIGLLFYFIFMSYSSPGLFNALFISAELYLCVDSFFDYIGYYNTKFHCMCLVEIVVGMWIVMVNGISQISSIIYTRLLYSNENNYTNICTIFLYMLRKLYVQSKKNYQNYPEQMKEDFLTY